MAGKTEAFTEKTVLQAKGRDKPYEIRDKGGKQSVRGLILRVQPSGAQGWYFQSGRGRRVFLGTPPKMTLGLARKEAEAKLGATAEGRDVAAEARDEKLTLGKYIDGDWGDYAQENIASFSKIKTCVKASFADLLTTPMSQISELDMARWKKGRNNRVNKDGSQRKPVKLTTMERDVTYLLAILNHAVKAKIITGHKLAGYKLAATLKDAEEVAQGTEKIRFLSADEEKRLRVELDKREQKKRAGRISGNRERRARRQELLPEIPPDQYADHLKPLVLLALTTGLRRGDLFTLQWSHVDLDNRQIRKVIGKSSHARRKARKAVKVHTLPLAKEAHEILLKLHRQRSAESDLVFPSPRSGARLDNTTKSFSKVLTDAEIENFTFHDLRHSFASRLVQAGVDINTVRELMTHSDIKMTLVYAHLSPDHKAAALEKAFGAVS